MSTLPIVQILPAIPQVVLNSLSLLILARQPVAIDTRSPSSASWLLWLMKSWSIVTLLRVGGVRSTDDLSLGPVYDCFRNANGICEFFSIYRLAGGSGIPGRDSINGECPGFRNFVGHRHAGVAHQPYQLAEVVDVREIHSTALIAFSAACWV